MLRVWWYLWASPVTLVGLLLCACIRVSGGSVLVRDGVVEACGGCARSILSAKGPLFRGGAAMTLGHVIIARDAVCLERSRNHERRHVQQFEKWGVLLLPLSLSISLWLRCRGLDPYLDNPFEQH